MRGQYCSSGVFLLLLTIFGMSSAQSLNLMPQEFPEEFIIHVDKSSRNSDTNGTRWAVLVAGSMGYGNYRHQADVCHAYQILKKGGLKDENIIVFMYDDIANNPANPRPGVIINKPDGGDVYQGVPKDYAGENATAANLYAVILGDKSNLSGGSGKVLNSGPNDNVFIYYTDHGGSGLIGMPEGDYVYANDLVDVLIKKHEANAYKNMVFYLEACESGSMFEGLLPTNISIYATTASNSTESSWGTYCPGMSPPPPPEFDTCLGDLYSIAWMEDCDLQDLRQESLQEQYQSVKERTLNRNNTEEGSHVQQFGNMDQTSDLVSFYLGANDNSSSVESKSAQAILEVVDNRDGDLLHLWHKFQRAPAGSGLKQEAKKALDDEISSRQRIDNNMKQIEQLVLGYSSNVNFVRPGGQALVDDWDCFKTLVKTYENHCGSLTNYGMKHTGVFANMCNVGVSVDQVVVAAARTC
ncbi:vacuolar-processing enzyme-like [Argentina anserina]|uniref:vacuolar-processing enzyme-like n=1 Tax=Argentina anserina TaxID=57926 RepID=UPI0021763149|nr:vacuolar-processing enzyme-like [Potentilla anserina]